MKEKHIFYIFNPFLVFLDQCLLFHLFERLCLTLVNVQSFADPHQALCLVLLCKTLKRKEKEFEHEMERLAREKIATQQRLAELKNELSQSMDVIEIDRVLRQTIQPEDDQASTSTASGMQACSVHRRHSKVPARLIVLWNCKEAPVV